MPNESLAELRERIFRAKQRRREELIALPLTEKVRLINNLHAVGMRLRKGRPMVERPD